MGAQNFIKQGFGSDIREVWNSLIEEANYRYGHDKYNGAINTCSLGRCTLRYDKPTKTNEKKAMDYIEKYSYGDKGVANYIDLGVVEYRVITFKKVHSKDTPSYKLQYVVNEGYQWSDNAPSVIKTFDNKVKADDYALELSIKNPNKRYYVTKEYVLTKGKDVITEISKEVKVYKSKPNLKPMKNRVILPIHKYIFYGWASI